MYLIKTPEITNPKLNLAIEEYAVRNLDITNEYLFVYSNSPSVIIGKNQNPFEEVNVSFLEKNKIEMLRRISGGGAVYHDNGNINFSFITENTRENFNQYSKFLKPIVNLLNRNKVEAKINQRNDLVIDEKKISGNAQFTSRKSLLSHGTLLYNADLARVRAVLNVDKRPINSKSTKSVRSAVTNISDYMPTSGKSEYFKKWLIEEILNTFSFEGYLQFDQIQWKEINTLSDQKYSNWDWNWGNTPKFSITVNNLNPKFKVILEINKGMIADIEFIQGRKQIKNIISALINKRFEKNHIQKEIIQKESGLSKEEIFSMVNSIFPF